jgi:hypothetical protein
MEPHVPEIIRVIQLVVAPVFLLTAVGTLINVLNARLGRSVDRRRVLEAGLARLGGADLDVARMELARTGQRIHIIYLAIVFAVVSALLVCMMIAAAFLGAMFSEALSRTIAALFVLAMLALIVSLLFFLREIFLAVSTPRYAPQ